MVVDSVATIKERLMTVSSSEEGASFSFKPSFYRLSVDSDRLAIHDLLQSNPSLQLLDTIEGQLKNLIELRSPQIVFTEEMLESAIQDHLNGMGLIDYGVWVYYPWRNQVIHILDEDEFIEIRTNRNKYKLSDDEQALLSTKKIGVVGLSVGHSIALTMAVERIFAEIRIADFDFLELTNLNRIRTGVSNLNLPKTVITAREISEIDPYLKVTCFHEGLNEDTLPAFLSSNGELDLILEECDSIDIKFLIRYEAKKKGIPVVMDTSDKGMIDIERFDLEPNRPIFHGLVEEVSIDYLRGLTTEEKVPFVLDIIGENTISKKFKASLIEVDQTITTWPQLGSCVTYGGGVTTNICRRLLLDELRCSGRFYFDPELTCPNDHIQEESFVLKKPKPLTLDEMKALIAQYREKSPELVKTLLSVAQIESIVSSAILAPSGGNCQPWKWLYDQGALFLFHEKSNSYSLLDYSHYASYVALGAAIENLDLHLQSLGFKSEYQRFPLSDSNALVAVIRFLPLDKPIKSELFDYIPLRETNRSLSNFSPVPKDLINEMTCFSDSLPGINLSLITDSESLETVSQMVCSAERLRLLERRSHHELMDEIRWTEEDALRSKDGIDIRTFDLSPVDYAGIKICKDWESIKWVSQWKGGKSLEKYTRKTLDSASALGLIHMTDFSKDAFLDGGRAMQQIWLKASSLGLSFQPVSALPFLLMREQLSDGGDLSPEMSSELKEMISDYETVFNTAVGEESQIMLFKLSQAPSQAIKSLRKDLSSVLFFAESLVVNNHA